MTVVICCNQKELEQIMYKKKRSKGKLKRMMYKLKHSGMWKRSELRDKPQLTDADNYLNTYLNKVSS